MHFACDTWMCKGKEAVCSAGELKHAKILCTLKNHQMHFLSFSIILKRPRKEGWELKIEALQQHWAEDIVERVGHNKNWLNLENGWKLKMGDWVESFFPVSVILQGGAKFWGDPIT